jgi:hypothetical protein
MWLDQRFWERLKSIEAHHWRLQIKHESARRGLEQVGESQTSELQDAWRRYCVVIIELERTTAEIEALRNGSMQRQDGLPE